MNKTGSFTITVLTEADYESACSVFIDSITDAFVKEGLGHCIEDIQSEIEHKKHKALISLNRSNTDTYFLIAKLDGKVIGTISYGPCGEAIQICAEHQLDHLGNWEVYMLCQASRAKALARR